MRNLLWVAEHQGGHLKMEHHRDLMHWARLCAEHILPLFRDTVDGRLIEALVVSREWELGKVKTGVAMKASLAAHAAARDALHPVSTAVARSVGQAVATAHMADHSVGAALYALKALKLSGRSLDEEQKWQIERIPVLTKGLIELIHFTLEVKGKAFKL